MRLFTLFSVPSTPVPRLDWDSPGGVDPGKGARSF